VADFVERYLLGSHHSAYPVEGFDGRVIGLVTLNQLRAVPPHERTARTIAEIAIPLADVPTAQPAEPLVGLLERIGGRAGGRALVFDPVGDLEGILTPSDVARAVDVRTLGRSTPHVPHPAS